MYNLQQSGQQMPQYGWPQGSYGQQQPGQTYLQQQQPVWYDAAGVPMGGAAAGGQPQQQLPGAGFPGLADPYLQGSMPAGGVGALPDGTMMPGAYGLDGNGMRLPLPPGADGQQQQGQQGQQQPGRPPAQQPRPQNGRNAYEQVDDWE
jgi:hypothetical protein